MALVTRKSGELKLKEINFTSNFPSLVIQSPPREIESFMMRAVREAELCPLAVTLVNGPLYPAWLSHCRAF